ncbi:hypothetical protein RQP46_009905 [Phenoliferia psychrophenolica]
MRASHKPTYTSGEQFYLDWYNTRVPAWLYCGLVLMCLVLGAYNFLDRAASSWPTQYYHSLHPPVAGTGRWYRSAILARWRKAAYKRNKVAGWFGMTSASQLIVIVLYALLNFLIAGLGAHHCARLFNANLPLLAGLAAKELSFITWITGLSYETLNVFHRWTARLILILACVHIGSARWVRIRWYTPFILSHVALFFLALITVASGYGPSSVIEILSPDTLRLSVRTAKRWTPGQHTFVHAPLLGAGGHPFSIASNFLPITHTYPDPSPASATQIFIIRVRSGFTRRLYEYALTAVEQQKLSGAALSFSRFPTAPLWPCWIEGAYGHNLKLHRFERVLLITGGSAPTVPYFDDDESSFDTESTWSTTDHSGRPVTLRLHSGRPDVRAILNEVIDEADYADSVAVGTCGPLMLTRSVSDAVADAIDPQKVYKGEHRRNISLHLETFGW